MTYEDTILADNPIAYWPLQDAPPATNGNLLADLSSHSYDLTTYRADDLTLAYNDGNGWRHVPDALGNGMRCDADFAVGSGGHGRTTAPQVIAALAGPHSVEGWLMTGQEGSGVTSNFGPWRILSYVPASGAGWSLCLLSYATFDAAASLVEYWPDGSPEHTQLLGIPLASTDGSGWRHFVSTWDGAQRICYGDGYQASVPSAHSTFPLGSTADPDSYVAVGQVGAAEGTFMALAHVALYDYALSPCQVRSHMNAGHGLPPIGYVGTSHTRISPALWPNTPLSCAIIAAGFPDTSCNDVIRLTHAPGSEKARFTVPTGATGRLIHHHD